jgi:hypothetical protein
VSLVSPFALLHDNQRQANDENDGDEQRNDGSLEPELSSERIDVVEEGQLPRTGRLICPTGKSASARVFALSSPLCKNILIFRRPKSGYIRHRPVPQRGARAIVTNAGRDAVDAIAPKTTGTRGGRLRRVVLTPRRWSQVCAKARRRRWQTSPVTGESTV